MKVLSCIYQCRYNRHIFRVQVDTQSASSKDVLMACYELPDTPLLQRVPQCSEDLRSVVVDRYLEAKDFWTIEVWK